MNIKHQSNLTSEQKNAIVQLWNDEYPETLNYSNPTEFDSYLDNLHQTIHYLLENTDEEVLAWAVCFTRDSERWFALLVNSKYQKKGFGSHILSQIKQKENNLSGWVIDHNNDLKRNGNSYTSPLNFYLKNDFSLVNECRLTTDKIDAVKITWSSSAI